MKPRLLWLIHPVFLACLALLLLNDLYLKYALSNWFTGKLSDITGLIAFTLFGFALVGARRKQIIVVVALFFCWWKSPLSESVILYFNQQWQIPLHRVVDYTDYLALCFLPLTTWLNLPVYTPDRWRRVAVTGSGLISFFAFCATSGPYHRWYEYYRKDEIPFSVLISTKKTDQEILYAMDPQHKGWRIDSVRYLPHNNQQRPYYQVQQPGDSVAHWVPLPDSLPVPMYYRQVSQPFYIIPEYIIDGDTLFGLEFSIENPAKKDHKRLVSFRSFRSNNKTIYNDIYLNTPLFRKYKQHFKKLLRGN
jgi:hypothetical protein